jgi:general secretion pathway protein N
MTRVRAIGSFIAVMILALLALCPIGAGIALSGLGQSGLSAREGRGTIWSGSLIDAHIGPVPLGDVEVGLRPLALLTRRTELGIVGTSGSGRLIAAPAGIGIGNVTAKLSLGSAFSPLPLDILDLNEVSIRFVGNKCNAADGRVRATFTGNVAGIDLTSGLSGTARCDGDELLLPLISQSAAQRLTLRISGDGRWRALLSVNTNDPAITAKLVTAGFQLVAGGYIMRLSGSL